MHMQIGTKGMKYGLQLPKQKVQPAQQSKKLNVFGDDDGSDDEGQTIGGQIARQAAKKQTDRKVAQLHAAALAEDASVFDYDGVYDSLKESEKPKIEERKQRRSRYIEGLLDKAKERNREQDIIYERQLLKDRKTEDHLFGDKDKFVTAAYKKKLEEDQKWLAEEKIREAQDAKQDVTKAGHMGNFYRNIMSNNSAFGTAQPPKRAAGPVPSSADSIDEGSSVPVDPEWEASRAAREAYEAAKLPGSSAAAERQDAGSAAREAAPAEEPSRPAQEPAAAERLVEKGGGSSAASQALEALRKDAGLSQAVPGTVDKAGVKAAPAESSTPALTKEEKAAAAKERFLARKRKAPA